MSKPKLFDPSDAQFLNPEWISHMESVDPDMLHHNAYFLSGPSISPSVQCSASPCTRRSLSAVFHHIESHQTTFEPMLLCYTCNRATHVKCAGLTLETFKQERLPWRCQDCRENIHNAFAKSYLKDSKYSITLRERRKAFLRPEKSADTSFHSEDDFDPNDTTAFEADRDSWTRYKTADDVSRLESQLKRLLEENASMKQQFAEWKKANSTACDSNASSFNFTRHYEGARQQPASESHTSFLRPEPANPPRPTVTEPSALNSSDSLLVREMREEKALSARRKTTPKIMEFDGEPSKWLDFSQDVERYQQELLYDDVTIKNQLRTVLKGPAWESVRGVYNLLTLSQVMQQLKHDYGDPMVVAEKNEKLLKEFKIKNDFFREDAIKLRQLIQGYFGACIYAKTGYMNSSNLGKMLYYQFKQDIRTKIREFYLAKEGGDTVVVDLSLIHDFVIHYTPRLDARSSTPRSENPSRDNSSRDDKHNKPSQLNFTATQSSAPQKATPDDRDWKFQIVNRDSDPRLGYDMTKVHATKKYCAICNKHGHYPLQCQQFKAMPNLQKLSTVLDKKVCANCLLTTNHAANDCDLKPACGYGLRANVFCQEKHHAAIHRAVTDDQSPPKNGSKGYRPNKGNTQRNTNRAQSALNSAKNNATTEKDDGPSTSASTNFHAQNLREYVLKDTSYTGIIQVNLHTAMAFQKTVKMLEHDFIGPNGTVTAYSVGDSAAEITLVRDDLRLALGISGTPDTISISWADQSTKLCKATKFDLTIRGIHPSAQKIVLKDCYAINDLNLPARSLDMDLMTRKFPYLQGFPFRSYTREQPVMLIGTTHASIVENIGRMRKGNVDDPVGVETALGFTVYGGNPETNRLDTLAVQAISDSTDTDSPDESLETPREVTNEDLYDLLKHFNAIESIGIRPASHHLIEEERKAVEILQEEMKELANGSIEVPLIWNRDENKNIPKLVNNHSLALRRQLSLEKKLAKDPAHLKGYNDNVKELIQLGYMRRATDTDLNATWPNIWYLPMGLVVNANKDPPKMRNVYDARCKYAGRSLNDLLLKGPDLLIDLITPLLRIRLNRIAFSADVKQMFHRMQICLRDQQCQRILWRENPDGPMETLILNAMAFGPSCSPFVSQYVKNWNADRWMSTYPDAAKLAKESVYMDDALIAEPTVEKATLIAKQLIAIFKSINWELVSFQSNSKEFLRSLPESHVKKDLIPLLEDEYTEHITKVLGCGWTTTDDAFIFRLDNNIFVTLMTEFEHRPTKKDLASLIARIFDVMGFISHYVIRGKILLQRTWKLKIGWDEEVPDEILDEWKTWLNDIKAIAKLKIPRLISDIDSITQAKRIELHVFCDAGVEAFGAAAYLVTHTDTHVTSRLLMAKAKVTPLRFHTETEVKEIPRLELMSALIASRLARSILKAYDHLTMEKIYWSDSEIVLRWILNPNQRLLKYVIGPIEEILEITRREEWRYVPSPLNPADTCTKFKTFDFGDVNSIWFQGPDFIKEPRSEWPPLPEKLLMKEQALVYNVSTQQLRFSSHVLPPSSYDCLIDKFPASIRDNWDKLRRAVARGLKILLDGLIPAIKSRRFEDPSLRKEIKNLNHRFRILAPADLERAEHLIFRKIQREHFPDEYDALSKGKPVKNNEFHRLNVFMDSQGLLRINSRANLNDLSFPQQFAPLVPRSGDTTYALLRAYHRKYDHIALESQLAEIRTRCWIPRLRQTLRVTRSRCTECKLREKQLYQPPMAPLPDYRINPTQRPFEVVALDCFGPYNVNCVNRYKKVWVLIFTCALTRFVHLHLLESLESIKVLEAIITFWAAHGPVARFVSDNGLNFVGAAKALREDFEQAKVILTKQHGDLASKLAEKYSVEWDFIPAYSPWMGGLYERLIKEVKRALYEILHKRKIEKTALNIAIHEVSHRLNLRPLTYNSIDAEDAEVLTPHLLATNRNGWPLLPGLYKGSFANTNDRDVYRRGRVLADEIMSKFTANYLPEYARRSKWYKDKREIRKNDLVLIIEPRMTRQPWSRGIVTKIRSSRDGKGRKADVKLSDGRIKLCSVRNLARLDLQAN